MTTTKNDIVTHNGNKYRLAHLAEAMTYEHRETVHDAVAPCTPDEFWSEFCRRYPDEADYLAEVSPVVTG